MKKLFESIIKSHFLVLIIVCVITGLGYSQEENPNLSSSNLKIFVQYKLAKANILTDNNIQVEVKGNKIFLAGTVPTIHDKKQAEIEAQSVDENYKIENEIIVKTPPIPDTTLTANVNKKLHSNVFYNIYDWIEASSRNGVVTLDGWAHLPWLKEQFENEVEKIAGVKEVINKIEFTFGPGEIGERAARLIYNDPMFWGMQYLADPPIHIIVNNGTVLLFGTVNSIAQSTCAADIVSFHTDAISVDNELKIRTRL